MKIFGTILLFMYLAIGVAEATPKWYRAEVVKVGMAASGKVLVQLTDRQRNEFTEKWFIANIETGREMLAVALTATTNDRLIQINVDTGESAWPTINAMYLDPTPVP